MKMYTVDIKLMAAFSVLAASEEEARRIVEEPLDAATIIVVEDGFVRMQGEASTRGIVNVEESVDPTS